MVWCRLIPVWQMTISPAVTFNASFAIKSSNICPKVRTKFIQAYRLHCIVFCETAKHGVRASKAINL